jgi:hypothetical protein
MRRYNFLSTPEFPDFAAKVFKRELSEMEKTYDA